VSTLRLFVYSGLLAILITGTAFAGGYQRTEDGTTRVWNENPKAGDLVTWSGARDAKGYATGLGTVTWFTPQNEVETGSGVAAWLRHIGRQQHYIVTSRESGIMVQGKFEHGPANAEPKKKGRTAPGLVVIHSHGHGDHTAGDKQFRDMPNVQFVAATPAAVQKAAGISRWPDDSGTIDLGGRMIDVIPIPGHNDSSIALYDRVTGNLLTGDSLYPGRLGVSLTDVPTFAASAARLAEFARTHEVAHVLGTHIEQSRTPFLDYPRGTVYQPNEHALELTRAHVIELNDAFLRMKDKPMTVALPEFTIVVRSPQPTKKSSN